MNARGAWRSAVAALLVMLLSCTAGASDTDLAEHGEAMAHSGWALDGRLQESCSERIVVSIVAVNQRLLVTVESRDSHPASGTLEPVNGEARCVEFTTEPGRINDPCVALSGQVPVPGVSPGNPYFTFESDGFYHHRVGSADYRVEPGWDRANEVGQFRGSCRLGNVWAAWGAEWAATVVTAPE